MAPPATVPVLGCPSLEESYSSLANQSSSRAMKGSGKFVKVREEQYCLKMLAIYFFADSCPVAFMPSICLEVSSPLGRIMILGNFVMRHEFY